MTTPTTRASELVPAEELAAFVAHPLAEMFPMISDDELRELAEDIRKNGMIEPITLCEGKILDGRNRFNAAKLVSFPFRRANFRELLCHLDPRAYVISANIKRRHLTTEQKREVIALLIKANPSKSDRQIAETTKVSRHTVGDVRDGLEATGQIAQLEKTTGADGKTRKRKPKVKGGSGAKGEKEKITYQKVVNAKTALNAYGVLEEHLLDALQDLSDKSDFSQAEDCARRTIEKLEERLGELQPEEEETEEKAA
jgi:ParB-like chromosome segregation protein Spo0J